MAAWFLLPPHLSHLIRDTFCGLFKRKQGYLHLVCVAMEATIPTQNKTSQQLLDSTVYILVIAWQNYVPILLYFVFMSETQCIIKRNLEKEQNNRKKFFKVSFILIGPVLADGRHMRSCSNYEQSTATSQPHFETPLNVRDHVVVSSQWKWKSPTTATHTQHGNLFR